MGMRLEGTTVWEQTGSTCCHGNRTDWAMQHGNRDQLHVENIPVTK